MLVERMHWRRAKGQAALDLADGALMRSTETIGQVCWVKLGGRLHALADRCPHQGAALSWGWCDEGKLVCPLHRYRFDPATGKGFDGEGERAEVIPLEVRADGVYLGREVTGLRLFGVDIF